MQIDPVDKSGRLKFFKTDGWKSDALKTSDLLTFRVEQFGEKINHAIDRMPCRGSVTYELLDRVDRKTYAYLTNCGKETAQRAMGQPVAFDDKDHLLQSSNYIYRFNKENYMQFDAIQYRTSKWEDIARDSQLMIKADVKNFFTMRFDSNDIVSQLEHTRLGHIGNLANLSFFLKILFFKIKMSLTTSVGFYEDSGHIPMMVNIPVDSTKYLNPRSGILYSWEVTDLSKRGKTTITMPEVDPDVLGKGYEEAAKVGMEYCKKTSCLYKYTVDIEGKTLSMDFGIDKDHVRRGFFPFFVPDLKKFNKVMGWGLKDKQMEDRIGMYFEVSGLEEGGYPWDFWLRLGETEKLAGKCPHGVIFRRIKNAKFK